MEAFFTVVGAIVCCVFGIALAVAVFGTFVVGLITLFDNKTK